MLIIKYIFLCHHLKIKCQLFILRHSLFLPTVPRLRKDWTFRVLLLCSSPTVHLFHHHLLKLELLPHHPLQISLFSAVVLVILFPVTIMMISFSVCLFLFKNFHLLIFLQSSRDVIPLSYRFQDYRWQI